MPEGAVISPITWDLNWRIQNGKELFQNPLHCGTRIALKVNQILRGEGTLDGGERRVDIDRDTCGDKCHGLAEFSHHVYR
jgi:hypothetical protein